MFRGTKRRAPGRRRTRDRSGAAAAWAPGPVWTRPSITRWWPRLSSSSASTCWPTRSPAQLRSGRAGAGAQAGARRAGARRRRSAAARDAGRCSRRRSRDHAYGRPLLGTEAGGRGAHARGARRPLRGDLRRPGGDRRRGRRHRRGRGRRRRHAGLRPRSRRGAGATASSRGKRPAQRDARRQRHDRQPARRPRSCWVFERRTAGAPRRPPRWICWPPVLARVEASRFQRELVRNRQLADRACDDQLRVARRGAGGVRA